MLTIGIDDAGRGPLIGPMVLAGVLIDKHQEKTLKEAGVKDSKLLFQNKREYIANIIKDNSIATKVVKISPEEIDSSLNSGTNLNTLEAIKMAGVINALNKKKDKIKVIVDCPSVNITKWSKTLLTYIKNPDNLTIVCEHKADTNHISAAAASILAKVEREIEVTKLKKEFGEIGSGYPADPITKEFLIKRGKELSNSGIFRKTWATWKTKFPQETKGQKSLDDF